MSLCACLSSIHVTLSMSEKYKLSLCGCLSGINVTLSMSEKYKCHSVDV